MVQNFEIYLIQHTICNNENSEQKQIIKLYINLYFLLASPNRLKYLKETGHCKSFPECLVQLCNYITPYKLCVYVCVHA